MKNALKVFIPVGVALTLSFGFAYGVGQQVLRGGANDPQVEITEGVSDALAQGQDPEAFSSLAPVDITKSLSPFVAVYDKDGKAVSGTAQLDGQMPTPPQGVFDAAKAKGENRLTWEPKQGVRVAAVVKSYSAGETSGYVLAGRSLRETEARTQNLLKLTAIAWAVALVITLLVVNLLYGKKEEHSHAEGEHHEHHHTS